MAQMVFSGDEAVAQAALDAGVAGAFAYPGTPSTEIMEYLQEHIGEAKGAGSSVARAPDGITRVAQWCSNEKTAYESALGVSFVG
ncbi:MAG: hypothetical protein ABFC85_11690, partial [Rectinema sp.]